MEPYRLDDDFHAALRDMADTSGTRKPTRRRWKPSWWRRFLRWLWEPFYWVLLVACLLPASASAQLVDGFVAAPVRHGVTHPAPIDSADVLILMGLGQSWMACNGDPVTTAAIPGVVMWPDGIASASPLLLTSTVPAYAALCEHPTLGAAELFLALWGRDRVGETPPLVHVMQAASGGTPIAGLQKGSASYTSFLQQIQAAAGLYGGMTVRVAILWEHGDSDAYATLAQYRASLGTLMADTRADILATFGQAGAPWFASQNALDSWRGGTSRAVLALHDDDGAFYAVGPLYGIEVNDRPLDGQHPTGGGVYEMGLMFGAALHDALTRGVGFTPLRLVDLFHEPGQVVGFLATGDYPVGLDVERVLDPGTAGFEILRPTPTLTLLESKPPNSNTVKVAATDSLLVGAVFAPQPGVEARITAYNPADSVATYFPRLPVTAGPVEVIHGAVLPIDTVRIEPGGLVVLSYEGDATGGMVQTGYQSADGQTGRGPGYGMQSNVVDSRREGILAAYHPSERPPDARRRLVRERRLLAEDAENVAGGAVWDARTGRTDAPFAWDCDPCPDTTGDWPIRKQIGGGALNKDPLPASKSEHLGRGLFDVLTTDPATLYQLEGPSVPVSDEITFCAVWRGRLGWTMGSADSTLFFRWDQGGAGASGLLEIGDITRSANHIADSVTPKAVCMSAKAHADPDSAHLLIRSNSRAMQHYTGTNAQGARTAPSTLYRAGASVGARTLRLPASVVQEFGEIRILPAYLDPDELEGLFQRLIRRWGVPAVP